MNVIGTALEELYRIFSILNRDKFDDELPEPVITIQKTRGRTLGHFTLEKTWKNKNDVESDEDAYYEINVDPRWFNQRSASDVAETLLHEMCHYCNKLSNIKDCNGNIHNKKFKSMAEKVGLVVEKGQSVGWGYTSMSEELKNYIEDVVQPDEDAFEYFRAGVNKDSKPKTGRTKTMFKFTCPECGQVAKGKLDNVIKCGHCDVLMEMEDIESDD